MYMLPNLQQEHPNFLSCSYLLFLLSHVPFTLPTPSMSPLPLCFQISHSKSTNNLQVAKPNGNISSSFLSTLFDFFY